MMWIVQQLLAHARPLRQVLGDSGSNDGITDAIENALWAPDPNDDSDTEEALLEDIQGLSNMEEIQIPAS